MSFIKIGCILLIRLPHGTMQVRVSCTEPNFYYSQQVSTSSTLLMDQALTPVLEAGTSSCRILDTWVRCWSNGVCTKLTSVL